MKKKLLIVTISIFLVSCTNNKDKETNESTAETSQQKSLQGQLEQEAQDKFWEAKAWDWSDEKNYADSREWVEEQDNILNSDSDAVNLGITTYGDNNGNWILDSMGEVDGGYFI